METPPLSYGSVLSLTIHRFKQVLPTLLIGAIIFGILTGWAQHALNQSDVMQQLIGATERGDAVVLEEVLDSIESGEDLEVLALAGAGKTFGLSLLFIVLLSLLANLYYFQTALGQDGSVGAVVQRSLTKLLPFVLLSIAVGIVSFAWIPFFGLLIALALMPKLLFSAMILLQEHTGVIDSIKQSWKRTNGYWLPIFGYTLLTAVVVIIILGIALALFSTMFGTGMVSTMASSIISQLLQAFMVIFVVIMGTLIFARPKG